MLVQNARAERYDCVHEHRYLGRFQRAGHVGCVLEEEIRQRLRVGHALVDVREYDLVRECRTEEHAKCDLHGCSAMSHFSSLYDHLPDNEVCRLASLLLAPRSSPFRARVVLAWSCLWTVSDLRDTCRTRHASTAFQWCCCRRIADACCRRHRTVLLVVYCRCRL